MPYGQSIKIPNLDEYDELSVYVAETGVIHCKRSDNSFIGTGYFNNGGTPFITAVELKINEETVINNGCGYVAFSQISTPGNSFKKDILYIKGKKK